MRVLVICIFALTMRAARVYADPPQFIVNDLGSDSVAFGINSSGQVAGQQHYTDTYWLGTRLTGMTKEFLNSLDGFPSGTIGFGINDSGQIAGFSAHSVEYAVRWAGTTPTNLGILDGSYSLGHGINASGQVAGDADTAAGLIHAVRWTGTTALDLGTMPYIDHQSVAHTYNYSHAYGINAAGEVAGYAGGSGGGPWYAVRWPSGTGSTPELLPPLGITGDESTAYGINDSGQIIGTCGIATASGYAFHAVRWPFSMPSDASMPTDLGTLGGTNSSAYGINVYGDVVGMSDLAGDASRVAFLFTGGQMYNLQDLLVPGSGFTNLQVGDYGNNINDSGQIAAWGYTSGGVLHALRLTPMTTPLVNWRVTYFGIMTNTGDAADTADPEHDGIPNLIEYAFGLNPTQNSTGQTPQWQIVGGNFVNSFTQPDGASDITYGAEWSTTLLPGSWTAIPDSGTPPEHTFSMPIGTNTKLFIRLAVTDQ